MVLLPKSLFGTPSAPSWEECLEPGERLGGPSPWGNSRYSTFRRCPYMYYWYFIKRMTQLLPDKALEIGGLYHEARARYGQAWLDHTDEDGNPKLMAENIDDLCRQAGFAILNRAEVIAPGIAGTAKRLYTAWMARYGPGTPGDTRKHLYGVEVLLEVAKPFPYSTRIDQWLWIPEYGGATINEIKSAAAYTGELISSYQWDAQFIGQVYLWNKTMKHKWGALKVFEVDLVTKSLESRVSKETVNITQANIKNWEQAMRSVYLQLIQAEMTGLWPQNPNYHSCHRCPLRDHCASGKKSTEGWRKKRKDEY